MLAFFFLGIPVAYWLGGVILSAVAASACDGKPPKNGKDDSGDDVDGAGDSGDAFVDASYPPDANPFVCDADAFMCDGSAHPDGGDAGEGDAGDAGGKDAGEDAGCGGACFPVDAGHDAGHRADGGGHRADGGGSDAGTTDAGSDGGADAGQGIIIPAGVKLDAAVFAGIIADVDPGSGGAIVFGGSPAGVWECSADINDDVSCVKKAGIAQCADPALETPVHLVSESYIPNSYLSTDFGFGLAMFSKYNQAEGAETPIALVRINENAANPENAAEACRMVKDHSDPGGLAAVEIASPTRPRFFMSTSDLSGGIYNEGTVLSWSERYGNKMLSGPLGFTGGVNPSAIGVTTININGEDKTALIAVNESPGDLLDPVTGNLEHYPAGIAFLNPQAGELTALKGPISLGDVSVSPKREIELSADGKTAYVTTGIPASELAAVNLETGIISTIPLMGYVTSEVKRIIVDGNTAYIVDESGRLVFVNLAQNEILGFIDIPIVPTDMAFTSGRLFVSYDNKLAIVNPAQVELQ